MELKIFLLLDGIINSIMLEYPPFGVLKYKRNFNKYIALAAIVLLDTIIFLPRTFGNAGPSMMNTIISCTHPIIWVILLFDDPLWKKLAVTVGYNIFVMLPLEYISMFLIHIFWDGSFFDDVYARNDLYLAGRTLNNMLYFITLIFVVLLWRRFVDKKKDKHTLVYISIALYQTVLMLMWLRIASDYSSTTKWIGFALEIFGFIVNLILFNFLSQMEQQLETEEKLATLYRQRDFEKEYYDASSQHLEQMKQQQQDFASQIHKLHEAVQQSQYIENISQILEKSRQNIEASKKTVYSLHPVINALLCVKEDLAKDKGIHMEIHCTHSSDIGIADVDICSILGNLLDNAIEACEKIDTPDRMIIVDIHEKAGFLIIKITNSISERTPVIKKIGFTSKTDTANHGIGLRMVERICTKYDGRLLLAPSENMETMSASAVLRKNVG